ncbi:hypothetical protein V493_05029 [Pseudogymnoascus sp. VKM F-4281 (FW-2241)]|nr:hypothetical protein V493_05029 [Pseudogymnoascus sp. VKM F-4281 (FW-2241)]
MEGRGKKSEGVGKGREGLLDQRYPTRSPARERRYSGAYLRRKLTDVSIKELTRSVSSLPPFVWLAIAAALPNHSSQKALIACLCVAVIFVSMRCVARWYKTRGLPWAAEDLFMYLALASFAITCALYLAAMPTLYNVSDIMTGKMEQYASLQSDLVRMLKEFFAVQMFFWLTLWAVKWSLLFMFKRLTKGIRLYTNIWWGALAFTALTFIGCVISGITSCSSMDAWFTAVMIIPIRVLASLRITLVQKLSIGVVFIVGIITMVFAIVRVISLNSSVNGGQVSTQWLMLWGGIEGAVAIIVGCLPSFAIFIRGHVEESRVQYESPPANASSKGNNALTHLQHSRIKSAARNESVLLEDMDSNGWVQDTGSRKSLVGDGIIITQAWSQKSHRETGSDVDRERHRKMGLIGVA